MADLGLGLDIFSLGPAHLGLEVEYDMGTTNVAPAVFTNTEMKTSSVMGSLVAKFAF